MLRLRQVHWLTEWCSQWWSVDGRALSLRHRADSVVKRISRTARRHGAVEGNGVVARSAVITGTVLVLSTAHVARLLLTHAAVLLLMLLLLLLLMIRHETGQRVRRSSNVITAGRWANHSGHAANIRQEFVVFQTWAPLGRPHLRWQKKWTILLKTTIQIVWNLKLKKNE